jgi:hypothetical protein
MAKYGKDEKRSTKICNCSRHVTRCDKNTKSPKSPIEFQSKALPLHEDKKV